MRDKKMEKISNKLCAFTSDVLRHNGNTETSAQINLGAVFKNTISSIVAIMLLISLAACGGTKNSSSTNSSSTNSSSTNSSSTTPQTSRGAVINASTAYQVSNLYAIPGNQSVSLYWDNPNALIEAFNISVYDAGDSLVEEASNSNVTLADGVEIGFGAKGVNYNITEGLMNNATYSFEVSVRLVGDNSDRFRMAARLQNRRNATQDAFSATSISASDTPARVGDDIVLIGPNQDGDQYADQEDSCPRTPNNLLQASDADKDGCYGAEDALPNDATDFLDYDDDLLGDSVDSDDDNDGVLDGDDLCQKGILGWKTSILFDYDGDGCRDADEDNDDDGDTITDSADACQLSEILFMSNKISDYDSDGCRDENEDDDDDCDTIADSEDACQ
ncbi:MAG: hypothetical protein HAW61_04685, partial [Candidatus Portiera sp.]|nr:hypothetical protein [Portiera sp.]